ncbi:hypothetical protein [Escherichia coli]|nr:hypothetical protein [Escherichia coli]MBC6573180.1 hypothetical protein [Escherichia coli]
MFKRLLFLYAALLFLSEGAYASVTVFIAPSWERNTDSVNEIYKYIEDINSNNHIIDQAYVEPIRKELGVYRDNIQKKLINFNGKGVCKLSITTGNTGVKNIEPPNVVLLNSLAENSSPDCKKLYREIQSVVGNESSLLFPEKIKSNGLLSIDMIFIMGK